MKYSVSIFLIILLTVLFNNVRAQDCDPPPLRAYEIIPHKWDDTVASNQKIILAKW